MPTPTRGQSPGEVHCPQPMSHSAPIRVRRVVELASLHDEMHRFPYQRRTARRTVGTARLRVRITSRVPPPAADRSWKSGVVVGIFEELGWTGFAVPRMTPPHGVFGTGLIVGLLWECGTSRYWGINSSSGGLQLAVLPAFLFTKTVRAGWAIPPISVVAGAPAY